MKMDGNFEAEVCIRTPKGEDYNRNWESKGRARLCTELWELTRVSPSLSLHFLPLFCLSSTPSIKMLLPIHLAILQQLHHLSLRLLSQKVTQPSPVRAPGTVYMGTRERKYIFTIISKRPPRNSRINKLIHSSLLCLPLFQMFIWGGRFNTIRERSKSPRRRNKIDNAPFRQ